MEINSRKTLALGTGCFLSGLYISYLINRRQNRTNKSLCSSFEKSITGPTGDAILIQKTYEHLSHLDDRIDRYVVQHSTPEPLPLKELREMTLRQFPGDPMIIDPLEAGLFQILIKMLDAQKCIEVGTYTGYNACTMALALPPDSRVVCCEIDSKYLDAGRPYWEKLGIDVVQKLDIRIEPAFDTFNELISNGEAESFDFVFLDAEWDNCREYYERALTLTRKGGVVAIDNTLCSGWVAVNPALVEDVLLKREVAALHAMNEFIATDTRVQLSLLKIADGVTLCRKL